MVKFVKGLVYENGTPSRTGLIALLMALVPLTVWAIATAYLVYTHTEFVYYQAMTIGVFGSGAAGSLTALGNKINNSINNSEIGQHYSKGETNV